MTAIPRYLQHARDANRMATAESGKSARERSEECEKRPRFVPGGRYQRQGPLLGIIHSSDDAFDAWRQEMRLPRAGMMTIEGERVIVADVRAALRMGYVDVVGVLKRRDQ